MKNTTKFFFYGRDSISEECFGISIIFIVVTIFLFMNAALSIMNYYKLSSDAELSQIKKKLSTIKAIEEKELKYFYKDNKYIDSDDEIAMGLKKVK
jgi:Na+/melibiose symporter-like transporter